MTTASGRTFVMSRPENAIRPALARTRPLRVPSKVDLPAPLAPTSATSSPCAISTSMPNSTGPAANPAVRPLTCSSGSAATEPPCVSLAKVSLDHTLVAQDDVRLPVCQRPPEVENDHSLAHADDDAHDVFDQDHRDARLVDCTHHLERVVYLDIVEAGHHLIEEQQLRPCRHSSGDLQSLAVRDRQRADRKVSLHSQAHELEDAVRAIERRPERRPFRVAAKEGADSNVLANRHRAEGLDDLEGPADAKPRHPVGRQP